MNAWLERPPKFSCTSRRACTDFEPDASHPAPESACSTCGAKAPSATAATTQASATVRA
jgi:hypothetical protein